MEKIRRCKQCGELRPESAFRQYYNRKGGRYKVCRNCERINTRYKYLTKKKNKGTISPEELVELEKFYELFDILRQKGLEPPKRKKEIEPVVDIDAEIRKHKEDLQHIQEVASVGTPPELLEWLTKDLTGYDPEYLQDVIAEELLQKYRPQLGIDPETLVPVYDDTHRNVLNKILKRFDDYEDEYYNREDEDEDDGGNEKEDNEKEK